MPVIVGVGRGLGQFDVGHMSHARLFAVVIHDCGCWGGSGVGGKERAKLLWNRVLFGKATRRDQRLSHLPYVGALLVATTVVPESSSIDFRVRVLPKCRNSMATKFVRLRPIAKFDKGLASSTPPVDPDLQDRSVASGVDAATTSRRFDS